MEFTNSEIIDSNGEKYRVGWDEHGWFSFLRVELYPYTPSFDDDNTPTIETEDGLMAVVSQDDYPHSISPGEVDTVVDLIEEGP